MKTVARRPSDGDVLDRHGERLRKRRGDEQGEQAGKRRGVWLGRDELDQREDGHPEGGQRHR